MIDSDDEQELLSDVGHRLGMAAEEVEHIVDAVADALGEILMIDEAALIAHYLPARWSVLLVEAAQRDIHATDMAQLVHGVSWRENVPLGSALEHATAVCECFGRLLPADVARRLHADLPGELAALLELRQAPLPPQRPSHERSEAAPATLADGRQGSATPLSSGRPDRAQTHSVAANADPHGETKLSGARGLTQERLGDSFAEGRSGPRRTVAG